MTNPNEPMPDRSSPAGSARIQPERQQLIGALIIVVAVVLGAILLFRGLSSEEVVSTTPADDAPATTVDRDAPPPTEVPITTEPPAPPPAEITVLVANGSGQVGLAGTTTELLAADGFETLAPTDANASAASSVVYFVGEDDAPAARLVAETLGIDSDPKPLPTPAPAAGAAGAQVLVVLGADAADAAQAGE
jgi:hypothetical protein